MLYLGYAAILLPDNSSATNKNWKSRVYIHCHFVFAPCCHYFADTRSTFLAS